MKIENQKSYHQFSRSLIPADGADLQAVLAVTIGANDGFGPGLVGAALQPKGDHLGSWDIMTAVTFLAGSVNAVGWIHNIGWCRIALIIAMGVGVSVAGHATRTDCRVLAGQQLFGVVRVANKTGAISPRPCAGGDPARRGQG